MNKPNSVITLKNVVKTFRGGRDVILKGIDLEFQKGKITYILGPSGTGKSVTLKHVLGLLLPDSGTVTVFGQDLLCCHTSTLSDRLYCFRSLPVISKKQSVTALHD